MPSACYADWPRIGKRDRARMYWFGAKEALIFLKSFKSLSREIVNKVMLESTIDLLFRSQNLDNYFVANY